MCNGIGRTECREYQNPCLRQQIVDLGSRGDAVLARHHEIHYENLRLEPFRFVDSFNPVLGLSDHFDIVFVFKHRSEAYPYDGVVIRHQDGYVTTYSSLAQDVAVKVGQDVTLGMPIGQVGTTALVETVLGDHVHFSVSCDGKPVDPEEFFHLGN
jgi:hypothetical protein